MAQGGYIYQQGASPQTESVISSRFKIFTDVVGVGKFVKLGVTSSFQMSETRTVEAIRGLGYGDQVAELVPGVTEPLSITIQRTCLYLANIMQVLGYKAGVSGGVRSIRHHRWPFDIKTEIVFSQLASEDPGNATGFGGGTPDLTAADIPNEGGFNNLGNTTPLQAVATVYEGCWISNYTTGYAIETAAVNENVTVSVTDIFDVSGTVYGEFLDSGLNSGDATGRSLLYSIS